MRYHKELLQIQASLAEFSEARKARATEAERFKEQDKQELLQRKIFLHNWLSAADTASDHESLLSTWKDHPLSGRWLLGRNQFRSWFDSTNTSTPLLWVHGIPGAGQFGWLLSKEII